MAHKSAILAAACATAETVARIEWSLLEGLSARRVDVIRLLEESMAYLRIKDVGDADCFNVEPVRTGDVGSRRKNIRDARFHRISWLLPCAEPTRWALAGFFLRPGCGRKLFGVEDVAGVSGRNDPRVQDRSWTCHWRCPRSPFGDRIRGTDGSAVLRSNFES